MIRFFASALLLAAVPAFAPAALAQSSSSPPRAWTALATPAPAGSFAIGNPAARVTLVEYVSYTCPHCAHFAAEARAPLAAMIRSGSVRLEVRNQVHDGIDLAAATLARCAGAAAFPALHAALMTRQQEWVERASVWLDGNRERIAAQPQIAQLRALAEGAGLTAIAAGAGVPAAAIRACFATDAAVKRTLAVSSATSDVPGTPAFAINGRRVPDATTWAELEPHLRAAGARSSAARSSAA